LGLFLGTQRLKLWTNPRGAVNLRVRVRIRIRDRVRIRDGVRVRVRLFRVRLLTLGS